ncbi:MAG: hypothetical protein BGO55_01075 [Sphingobacteriales bacterium 50-39]|nr:MAG: hypothetical protein BGO55_01075 [Sphingobacteriales bacterium 50-39]
MRVQDTILVPQIPYFHTNSTSPRQLAKSMISLRSYIQRLYLVRCWQEYKLLFFLAIIFIGAVLYGHKSSCEVTPALVMGMYAGREQRSADDFLVITADNELLDLHHTLDEPRRMMIYSTLSAFYQAVPYQGAPAGEDPKAPAIRELVRKHPYMRLLSSHAMNAKEDYGQYLPWLLQYIRHSVKRDIQHLGIYQLHVHYDKQNLPVADYRKILYELESPHTK